MIGPWVNAINLAFVTEVSHALDAIKSDKPTVLLFTREKNTSFEAAGPEIAIMKGYTPLIDNDFLAQIHEFFFRLESLPIQGIACRDL